MSGSIQSSNYVRGVSGWKINESTGEFEINTCSLGSAAIAIERQIVSIEVSSWSKCDLPKNAANLLQFMQTELQKVPERYRHAAEFEEFDASYGDGSFNSRLFLSYSRLETEQELFERLHKVKDTGSRLFSKNGLVSLIQDGVVRVKIGEMLESELYPGFSVKMKANASEQCYFASFSLDVPSQLDSSVAYKIKEVIRAELRPGDLLHRSR